MSRPRYFAFFCILLAVFVQGGCSSRNYAKETIEPKTEGPSAPLTGTIGARTTYKGENVSSIKVEEPTPGIAIPDGQGGVVIVEGEKPAKQDPAYVAARELKLRVRELAEQLISGVNDPYLRSSVALPVSFVNLGDMDQTSAFGRLIAEQLIYEFNQRGFPVREYRITDTISAREKEGEFYLTRLIEDVKVQAPGAVVIAGTYHADPRAIFVNARLIKPDDGRVLRTGNLVMPNNSLTKRMLRPSSIATLQAAPISIKKYEGVRTNPTSITPSAFDTGGDIH